MSVETTCDEILCAEPAYDADAITSDITPTDLPIELGSSGASETTLSGMFEVLYAIIVEKAKVELDAGRIVDSQYATIIATSLVELIKQSINYQLAQDKILIENQIKQEQWVIQQEILGYQRDMVAVDRNKKFAMIEKDYDIKVAQEGQILADTQFTVSKEEVMINTRFDNIRIKAASEFADFLKYISAADAIPSREDFANIRLLIESISTGIIEPDNYVPSLSVGASDSQPVA